MRGLLKLTNEGLFTIFKNTTTRVLTEDERRSTYSQMR